MKVSEDYSNTPGMMPKSREDTCNIKMEDRQAPETQHCFDAGTGFRSQSQDRDISYMYKYAYVEIPITQNVSIYHREHIQIIII